MRESYCEMGNYSYELLMFLLLMDAHRPPNFISVICDPPGETILNFLTHN